MPEGLGRGGGCSSYDKISSRLCRANTWMSRLLGAAGASLPTPRQHLKGSRNCESVVMLRWAKSIPRALGAWLCVVSPPSKCLLFLHPSPQGNLAPQLALSISAEASPSLRYHRLVGHKLKAPWAVRSLVSM